jgi:hypothetical protein
MMNRISTRDWEALSAYLDGQLPVRETGRLERRLAADPNLQEALEDLQNTRALVRNIPRLRAPRNFTLTPEMVGMRQPRPPAYPAFQLASVLATILFVLVMVGDFLFIPGVAMAPAPQELAGQPQITMLEEATEMAPAEPYDAPPGMGEIQVESYAEGSREDVVGAADAPAGEVMETGEPGLMQVAPESTPEPVERIMVAPQEPDAAGVEALSEQTQPEEKSFAADVAPQDEPGEDMALTMDGGQERSADVVTFMQERSNLVQAAKVLLAGVAILSGLAAIYLRRKTVQWNQTR